MDTKNKMMKHLSIFFLLIALFSSCINEPESDPFIDNTFTVTLNTGETKTMILTNEVIQTNVQSWVNATYQKSYIISVSNDPILNRCYFSCSIPPPVETGKEYASYRGVVGSTIYVCFEIWLDTYNEYDHYGKLSNSVKSTVIYTAFNYPGRVTGIVKNYDINGNVLVTGIFNFISK